MTAILAVLFRDAIPISGVGRMLLILPLCLAIAIVYKAVHCDNLARLPRAVPFLWITIVIGMYAVGVALWALFEITT